MTLDLKQIFIVGMILIAGYQGYRVWVNHAIDVPAGIIAPDEPKQIMLENAQPFAIQDYQATPVATFNIEARLISKRDYSMDREAKLSPIDLGVSWGKLSDTAVLKEFDFSQNNRFLFYRYDSQPSVPVDEVNRSIANLHIIPATPAIEKRINKMQIGSVIHLQGKLVDISGSNYVWKTSISRTDTGKGACEVLYVEDAF